MRLTSLFGALDAKPFRPFLISLSTGDKIEVKHPDNVFVLPSRSNVHHIEIYHPGTWEFAMIYPEAIGALLFNGKEAGGSQG